MNSKGNFQYIVLGLFIFFAVGGVLVFALLGKFGGGSGNGPAAEVSVWGDEPAGDFAALLAKIDTRNKDLLNVKYTEIRPEAFDQTLIEALARGEGPDIILLDEDSISRHKDKIFPVPYENFSQRNFKDIFAEAGEIYLSENGVLGFPMTIDPLVMYWNRSFFSNKGQSLPPSYWDEFYTLAPKFTDMDNSRNILKSFVAFGEYANVSNAKNIIAALLFQSGNPIISVKNSFTSSVLGGKFEFDARPADSVMRFYTEFSNPSKATYSWNKARPDSKLAFLSGDLAVYFGFASELSEIRTKNPNLNFDVVSFPQIRDAARKITFGRMKGLAILKSSKHSSDALAAIIVLISPDSAKGWSDIKLLPPVRRDLLNSKPKDAFMQVFYNGAVISKSWLDPDRKESAAVFQRMVENITSGRMRISEAVDRADLELNSVINK